MPTPTIKILAPLYSLSGNKTIATLWFGTERTRRYKVYKTTTADSLLFEGEVYSIVEWLAIDMSTLFNPTIDATYTYKVELYDNLDALLDTKVLYVYPGAISKLLYRRLAAAGTDIFTFKLKNRHTNFLITTRTLSSEIVIPENELWPIYFYGLNLNFKIYASDNTHEVYNWDSSLLTSETLQSIDIRELRRLCATNNGVWANDFRFVANDATWACSVLIAEAAPTPFVLKFKNSYGVYELLALYEAASYAPKLTAKNNSTRYDATVGGFKQKNGRKEISNVYKLQTGMLDYERRHFLTDALLSDDCWLLVDGQAYEANIEASDPVIANTDAQPASIELTATLVDADSYYSPAIRDDLNILTSETEDVLSSTSNIIVSNE